MVLPSMAIEVAVGRKRYDIMWISEAVSKMHFLGLCKSCICSVSMQVSVLQGAPETVRELLSSLGLQKYTLGLSLNGWDDLDYFR